MGHPGKLKRHGFTLIEILVVVTILALLAAILFPVFARARDNARRTSCLGNMRQLGLSFMHYAQDNDETMVNVYMYYGPGKTNLYWWQDTIQPYAKSRQILLCPYQENATTYTAMRPLLAPYPLHTAYAANNIYNDWQGGSLFPPLRAGQVVGRSLSEFDDATTTIVISEVTAGEMEFYDWQHTDWGTAPRVDKRHLSGSNFVFADGHAKWQARTQRSQWTLRMD